MLDNSNQNFVPVKIFEGFLWGICLTFASLGQSAAQTQRVLRQEISLKTENDVYFPVFSDRYYTNGLYGYFRRALKKDKLKFLKGKQNVKIIYQLEIGQAIFNPQTPFVRNPDAEIDRPFAGWLYGGLGLHFYNQKENYMAYSLQIGTLGEASGAQNLQTWYHLTFGFAPPVGWQTQIQEELGVNLKIDWMRPIHQNLLKKRDIILQNSFKVGNTFSGVQSGILFRFGKTEKLYQSITTHSRIQAEEILLAKEKFYFLRPSIRFVGYNATIQGGWWNKKSPYTFVPRRFVGGLDMGFAYSTQSFAWEVAIHIQTPETQKMNWFFFASHQFSIRF